MTPERMKDIRIGAGLSVKEMGSLLGFPLKHGSKRVLEMERGARDISGPVETVLLCMERGCTPVDLLE